MDIFKKGGLTLVLVAVAVMFGVLAFKAPTVVTIPTELGATPGSEFYNLVKMNAGNQVGNYIATSTTATTYTMVRKDMVSPNGGLYDTVSFTPNVGDITVTFPASSTLAVLSGAGESATQCWHNASTTSGIDITWAAGTGIDLMVASSTVAEGGAPALTTLSNQLGCFKFVRQADTDITAVFERYVAGD